MAAQITVHVAGSERSVPEQTTAGELFEGERGVLVARVDGELRDLAHVLADGDVVEPVTAAEQDGLDVLRHSAAHVLAQAVQEVHPEARLGIGPPIRDGVDHSSRPASVTFPYLSPPNPDPPALPEHH